MILVSDGISSPRIVTVHAAHLEIMAGAGTIVVVTAAARLGVEPGARGAEVRAAASAAALGVGEDLGQ